MLLLAGGEILLLGISPELGFAFPVAALAYAGLRVWRDGARWLLPAIALVGASIFLFVAGRRTCAAELLRARRPEPARRADGLRPGPEDAVYQLDVAELERLIGKAPVATPIEVSPAVEEALKSSAHYRPEFYSFFVDVLNDRGEATKISELNQARVGTASRRIRESLSRDPADIDGVQGFVFPYPLRHPVPYDLGSAFSDNIDAVWTAVQHFGPNILYRRRHTSAR